MDRNLQVGDAFTITRALGGAVKWHDNHEPYVDVKHLSPIDICGPITTCPWTERGENGWERRRETVLDRSVDATGAKWIVMAAAMGGGGYGHGPGDYYPDTWQVMALRSDDPSVELRFSQGGNLDNISPGDVALV